MDIKQNQMVLEQKYILRKLAESVAKPKCRFLEVGSWVGDSTIVLGKVAQQCDGYVVCVDWWKGNIDTELMDIAVKEDIFSYFWRRICSERLEDVVIPIRSNSDIGATILKEQLFDLVFIDSDHKYEATMRDIKQYAPLVKRNNGILCGHDCEGYISDYEMSFLDKGKGVDYFETVHCGVVLAVGSIFNNYSINYGIWSVKATPKDDIWEPTNLPFPEIKERRQPIPPSLGRTKNCDLFRYGKFIYVVPCSLSNFDVTDEEKRNMAEVLKAKTLEEIEKLVGERITFVDYPILLDSYRGYNFVQYKNRIFILSQELGGIDLTKVSEINLKKYQEDKKCIISTASLDETKHLLDQLLYKILEEDLRKEIEEKEADIVKLQTDLANRDSRIEALQEEITQKSDKNTELQALLKENGEKLSIA